MRPYGLLGWPARLSHSSPALNSSSVPLYVRRDRTDYEGREPQDLGQRDSHTALELCNIIGSVYFYVHRDDFRIAHELCNIIGSMLLYVQKDCTDYEGQGPKEGHPDFHTAPIPDPRIPGVKDRGRLYLTLDCIPDPRIPGVGGKRETIPNARLYSRSQDPRSWGRGRLYLTPDCIPDPRIPGVWGKKHTIPNARLLPLA